MRQGIDFVELASLHRDAKVALADVAAYFLVLEPLSASAEHATIELAAEGGSPATPPALDARVFAIASGGSTLGRAQDCDIEIADSAISKLHLRLARDERAMTVSDLGSQNGTKLNGVRLEPETVASLRSGDVLDLAERYRALFLSADALVARLEGAAPSQPSPSTPVASRGLLAGKVAVITGAGRGLGRAYALRFAEEGCHVVVNDLGAAPDGTGTDPSVAASVVSEIEQAGGAAVASVHDVSTRAGVDALFELACQRFGGVDILVCSAGALHAGSSVLELDEAIWDRLQLTNARGTFLSVQAAARQMVLQRRPGRIITTSSMAAMNGNAGLVGYAASKAAVYALSQSAALELAAHGITVNTLTPMAWTRLTSTVPAVAAMPNVEELLSARYVADVALFLASELAAEITGQVVDVGGTQLSFYKMKQSAPAAPSSARWTPQELQRRWQELTSW